MLPNRSMLVFNPDANCVDLADELGLLSVTGELNEVPQWVVENLRPAEWEKQLQALQSSFGIVANKAPSDALSCLATRTLLIHQWRRLLLRYPPIPGELKGKSWQLENECRQFVARLYHRLSTLAETWLDEQGTCIDGAFPTPTTTAADRFSNHYQKQRAL